MVRGYRPRTLSKRSSSVSGVSATAPTTFARLGPARESPALVQRVHEDPSRAWMVGWTRPDRSRGNSDRPGGVALRARSAVSHAAYGRSSDPVARLFLIWDSIHVAAPGPPHLNQCLCYVVRAMPRRGPGLRGGGCAASCARYPSRRHRPARKFEASSNVRARFSRIVSAIRRYGRHNAQRAGCACHSDHHVRRRRRRHSLDTRGSGRCANAFSSCDLRGARMNKKRRAVVISYTSDAP